MKEGRYGEGHDFYVLGIAAGVGGARRVDKLKQLPGVCCNR